MRKTLNLSITIYKGSDFNVVIEVPAAGEPIDITGYTFEGVMKTSTAEGAEDVAEFSFSIRDQVLYKGQVTWSLSAEDSLEIPASVSSNEQPCRLVTPYVYDILMTDTLGAKTRIIQGRALVSPNVTGGEEA